MLATPASGRAAPIALSASIDPEASLNTPIPTQAGGHPDITIGADFLCGVTVPCADQQPLKNLLIGLPPGLLVNPQATPQCSGSDLSACDSDTKVGEIELEGEISGSIVPPIDGEIYNLEPNPDELARFGIYVSAFPTASQTVGFSLGTDGTPVQEAIDFPDEIAGNPIKIRKIEYTLFGIANGNPFVYAPTNCGPQLLTLQANSYDDATFTTASDSYTTTGCNLLPSFVPSIDLTPDSTAAGQPSGYDFTIDTGFDADAAPTESLIRNIQVVFPEGLSLSASAGGQLDACSVAQLASHSCPTDSEIGTIEVTSPFVADPVQGHAYFGQPTDAEPYPVLFAFDGAGGEGIGIELHATTHVNEQTGQITSLAIDQPQLPFERFELQLRSGDHAVLVNPNNCGSYHAAATFTPWSGLADRLTDSPPFDIDQGFGHNCPQARGFSPALDTTISDATARARTHLRTIVTRSDNDQQLTALKFQTARGLTATLAELPYCPAAAAFSGDCPEATKIGDINVLAGAGNTPIPQQGAVYLTEPLHDGDVIGFSFVVPAKAGPIDFGKVVTTSGVRLDKGGDTATTDAAEIPRFFKGIPVPIRKIDVDINSDHFLINPSGCDAKQFIADFFSDEGAQHTATAPLQITGCDRLPFNPKLTFTTNATGQPSFDNQKWHPPVRAVVTQQVGEAAIKSTRTAIPDVLRPNLSSVQRTLCQGDSLRNCPPISRVGEARVETPLLPSPLFGYMYLLQEPGKILPKVALALDGPVSVDVDSRNAIEGIRTVNYFENVPDVPIRKVDLFFYGGTGNNGILNAFSDLCVEKSYGDASFTAHNGKQVKNRPLLQVEGCPPVAKLSVKRRKLRVSSKGIANLRLRCGSKNRCAGEATLLGGGGARSAKLRTTAKGRVKIKPRRTGVVRLKLLPKALKQLRKHGRLRAKVSVALVKQPVQNVGAVTLVRARR